MELSDKLTYLPGIGPTLAGKLAKLNLFTIEDLINHYPFRYEDYSKITKIAEAKVGDLVTVKGEVWAIKNNYTRFGRVLTKATINDGSGSLDIAWFNQSYLVKNILPGDTIQVSGKVDKYKYKITIMAPEWEKVPTENSPIALGEASKGLHTGRIVSIYPETFRLSSKWFRLKISQLLPRLLPLIKDPLPDTLTSRYLKLPEAIEKIHFPKDFNDVRLARQRLSFDELFFIQLLTQKRRMEWQKVKKTNPLEIDRGKLNFFIKNLPFELTSAQKRVVEEIILDLKKDYPMNRLLQGDVGSGKTVVAAIIAYMAYLNNLKTIIMAPTEILAFQHHTTLTKLLSPYGIEVGVYTGSRKFDQKKSGKGKEAGIEAGLGSRSIIPVPDIIVGTHALLTDKLTFEDVGLVVIDEQQRFGVEQRSVLRNKAKLPHFLTMTATPIPRTVALTVYGDLDLSVVDELPKGRKIVKTFFVPQKKRESSYQFILEKVNLGQQVYIITPLIEEPTSPEGSAETTQSIKAAKVEYERLQKEIFTDLKVGLLHGKLKSKEKEAVINSFKEHQIDILVSTSVVEVGVDVPNATIMVIEGSERFGLAQLHQLRGRVGRGSEQSFTFLFLESEYPESIKRVRNLEFIYDGLKLSELDLKLRGSGEVFGLKQSGQWNLKIASLSDIRLVEETKVAATKILVESAGLDKYPLLRGKLSNNLVVLPD